MIKLAFACGYNGEFGNGDTLPWGKPFKQDMEAFKKFTEDCVLVMGRKTFESLPCKLRGLKHIVFSTKDAEQIECKSKQNPDMTLSGDVPSLVKELASVCGKPVCVIGGAEIIEILATEYELIDEVLCTIVYKEPVHPYNDLKCDTYININTDEVYDSLLDGFNYSETKRYQLDYKTILSVSLYKNLVYHDGLH